VRESAPQIGEPGQVGVEWPGTWRLGEPVRKKKNEKDIEGEGGGRVSTPERTPPEKQNVVFGREVRAAKKRLLEEKKKEALTGSLEGRMRSVKATVRADKKAR